MLTPRRRGARRSLAALLERGIVSGGDAGELMDLIGASLDLECLALGQGFGFTESARTFEVPAEWMAIHGRVAESDPSLPFLRESPDGSIFHVLSAPRAELEENEALRALFRFGFSDALVGLLRAPFGGPVFFALYRVSGAFDEDERAELALLQPALASALAARTALDAIRAPPDETRAQALGRVVAHVEIDLPGGDITWSPRAAASISRATGRPIGAGDLARMERGLVAIVRHPPRGARSHQFVLGLRAELATVPSPRRRGKRVLVMLVEDSRPAIDTDHPLLEMLTRRQRDVAILAAHGRSLPRIGAELGISAETARTHLRAVYAILGPASRTQLAALLAR